MDLRAVVVTTQSYDKLPPQYCEFWDICDKKNANQLSPLCPYACPINLLPGVEITFGHIYYLSEPKLKVLREWVDDNLEKGFSAFPHGAVFFFVEK